MTGVIILKKNNKGFMLVELMVVSVAVLILFIAVYTNFYPRMGEYENRIYYNNVEQLLIPYFF